MCVVIIIAFIFVVLIVINYAVFYIHMLSTIMLSLNLLHFGCIIQMAKILHEMKAGYLKIMPPPFLRFYME